LPPTMLANGDCALEHEPVYCASHSFTSSHHEFFPMKLPRKRAVLTDDQAAAIFRLRGSFSGANCSRDRDFTSRSTMVSNIFGVSPKAVRDIWNKRTWRHCTQALWTEEDNLQRAEYLKNLENLAAAAVHTCYHNFTKKKSSALRKVGRPCGSKDSKPRRPRKTPLTKSVSHGEHPALPTNSFEGSELLNEVAAVDSNSTWLFDRVQEDNCYWASAIAAPASLAGMALDEEDDLRRSFPFFLVLEDQASTPWQEPA
jgi:hypothetical protein